MNTDQTFALDELSTLADLPRRTVRYYIQIGLVDRPEGAARGAFYTRRHLEQLLLVRKWQLAGLSLERIAELVRQPESGPLPPAPRRAGTVEVWSHLVVAEGIELTVEPGRAGLSPEQVRALFRAVTEAHTRIRAGAPAPDHPDTPPTEETA
jgi:DNA-binding transcriptional MerR regulator